MNRIRDLILAVVILLAACAPSVQAAPAARTCYSYRVKLSAPACTRIGWCLEYVDVPVNGLSRVTVRVAGWHLRPGRWVTVEVCR